MNCEIFSLLPATNRSRMFKFNNNSSVRPQHAIFQVSKFSYPGRNGTFLDLVGIRKQALERVVLLGSGPIEPFEVAALPCFKEAEITAIDSDTEVCEIVRRALKTGQLDVKNLARVCRSSDSENSYFVDHHRMWRQLCKVRQQGWYPKFDERQATPMLFINQNYSNKPKIINCDLRREIPNDVERADLIFEGFMLINWVKIEDTSSSELFLKHLYARMSTHAWFASATSVTHYIAELPRSKPFFRQVLGAGFLPGAGLLLRWSVADDGHATSQFGAVFQKGRSVDDDLFQLGVTFEEDTRESLDDFGLRYVCKTVDLGCLMEFLEKGDVLCYRSLGDGKFRVVMASWMQLTQQCRFKELPYELALDAVREFL